MGRFSVTAIARHSRVISEEVNIFDGAYNTNTMKKLLEGVEFEVNKKHADPITVKPKTIMVVSNDVPPNSRENRHIQALHDRIDIYEAKNRLKETDPDYMDKIKVEAPLVAVWATRTTNKPGTKVKTKQVKSRVKAG